MGTVASLQRCLLASCQAAPSRGWSAPRSWESRPLATSSPGQGSLDARAGAAAAAGGAEAGAVEPPPTVPWPGADANRAWLAGLVLSDPELARLPLGQSAVRFRLGFRPPFLPPALREAEEAGRHAVTVDAYGHVALQVAQYVRCLDQVVVSGHLREDRWAARNGRGARAEREVKLVATRVSLVEKPTAQGGGLRVKPYFKEALDAYQSGLSFEQVAQQRGIKPSTAAQYVLDAARLGEPLDWARAAADLQMGPAGSAWLAAGEVWAQLQAVAADEVASGRAPDERTALLSMRLAPAHALLLSDPGTRAKVEAQEQVAGGASVTYGQLRLVAAMRLQGVDWDAVVTRTPGV